MASAGIDYGMGATNINHETGIRFGVISQHSVSQAWADSAEPDYGKPTCPKCGNDAIACAEYPGELDNFQDGPGCADFVCTDCEYVFDSQEAYSDEPQGWTYESEGYELTDCLDSDIFVLASPFYTYARFCSPCVPGAGNIDSADEYDESSGVKTYCLGHDWFEDGKAPYTVYSVATNQPV